MIDGFEAAISDVKSTVSQIQPPDLLLLLIIIMVVIIIMHNAQHEAIKSRGSTRIEKAFKRKQ